MGGESERTTDGSVIGGCVGRTIARGIRNRNRQGRYRTEGGSEHRRPRTLVHGEGSGTELDGWRRVVIADGDRGGCECAQGGIGRGVQCQSNRLIHLIKRIIHNRQPNGLAGLIGRKGKRAANGSVITACRRRAVARGIRNRDRQGRYRTESGSEHRRPRTFVHRQRGGAELDGWRRVVIADGDRGCCECAQGGIGRGTQCQSNRFIHLIECIIHNRQPDGLAGLIGREGKRATRSGVVTTCGRRARSGCVGHRNGQCR